MNNIIEVQFHKTKQGQWIYDTEWEAVFMYKENLVDYSSPRQLLVKAFGSPPDPTGVRIMSIL